MSGWIPVPETGQRCLVRIKETVFDCATLVPGCPRHNHEHCGRTEIKVGLAIYNTKYAWPYAGITHWMPLPNTDIEDEE